MSSPSKSSSTSTSTSFSQPLTDISPNTSSKPDITSSSSTTDPFAPTKTTTTKDDTMPTTRVEQAATYISPSDAMLSPATKKLSEIKGRRFAGAGAKTGVLNSKALFQRSLAASGKENQIRELRQNAERERDQL